MTATGSGGWTLAIDVGTSRTAGALWSGGRVTPLEIEGNRWMPSTVAVTEEGNLVVGQAAAAIASARPDRAERAPKRNVGSPVPMVLGEHSVSTTDAFATLMSAVAAEGRRRHDGADPSGLVLTHPVRWEETRQAVLQEAASAAGLPEPTLIPEPVAAAYHYARGELAEGQKIAVYDLGGGTFDTVVMQRTPEGFEVVGPPGGDESIGGDHFDHLVFLHLGGLIAAQDPELWQKILTGTERQWMRAAFDLLAEARQVKETLSTYPSTQIYVPVADRELLVTREELESLISEPVDRSIDELLDTVEDAEVRPEDLAAVFLVGGSSRIPMVAARLATHFGERVRTRDEPKSVVVEGAAMLSAGWSRPTSSVSARGEGAGDRSAEVGVEPILDVRDGVVAASSGTRLVVIGEQATEYSLAGPVLGLAAHRGGAVVLLAGGQIRSLAEGRRRWSSAPVPDATLGPVISADTTVVADSSGMVAAVDRRGSVNWKLPTGHQATALAASASAVLVSTEEGRVLCLDAMSGRIRWIYPTRDRIDGPVELAGNTLHVVSADGILYALEVETGRPRWAYRLDSGDGVLPAVVDDVLVVPTGGNLVGLERSSGEERWRVAKPAARLRSGAAGGVVIGIDRSVHVISAGGDLVFVEGASDAVQVGSMLAVVADSRVSLIPMPGSG